MRRFRSVVVGGVVGSVLLVTGLAAPAAAAPTCSAGYVCLFNRADGSDGIRVAFQYTVSNYAGRTFYNSKEKLDNNVDAVFYNFTKVGVGFYRNANKGSLITSYKLGQQGFRNWSAANRNVASSHYEL